MNRHLVIGVILIVVGLVLVILSYTSSDDTSRLVIRGTHISYGWLLVVLGGIRLIRARGAQG